MKKFISVMLVAVLVLTGCSNTGGADEVTVGFSISSLNNPFFTTMSDAATAKGDELGVKVNVVDAGDDSAKQMTDIEDLVSQGADVVIINPVDSDAIVNSVDYLNEKNIPVVTVDRAANGGTVTTKIASDNVLGGKLAGDYAVKLLNGSGNVGILEGVAGASATNERGSGFEGAIKGKLDVVAKQTADFDRAKALQVTEDIIASNPEIQLIFAENDEMALGAEEALNAANRDDVIVIGFDAIDDAKTSITNGEMEATVEQQPAVMGEKAIETAQSIANGDDVESEIPVEVKLVTSETL